MVKEMNKLALVEQSRGDIWKKVVFSKTSAKVSKKERKKK
jgi:hypothetical protein